MDSLATLYGQHEGRVSQRWSSYLDVFDRELTRRRREPVRMLEIGVQNGGSLELWAAYFPEARILIGSDIDERCAALDFDDPRIQVVVGDVTNRATQERITALSGGFDVIIDDGSHRSPDIIAAFVATFPLLVDGGAYIVEDLHCSYDATFGGGLFTQRSALGFLRRLVDVINRDHWGLERSVADHLQPLVDEPLPPSFLASTSSIASIEFHDSLCIIRKDHGPSPRLGTRIVTGALADVDPGPLAQSGRPYSVEPQLPGAANTDPIDHERELAALIDERRHLIHQEKVLRQELDEVWKRLERTLASRSYRIMNGPRRVFRALFRRGVSGSS